MVKSSKVKVTMVAALTILFILPALATAGLNDSPNPNYQFASISDYLSSQSEAAGSGQPAVAKAADALPALIWNPLQLPSGDSLLVTLWRAGYDAFQTADLSPYSNSLSSYYLFVVGGGLHEQPHLPSEEVAPFLSDILDFLAEGGAIYWEGASSLSSQDPRLFFYFQFAVPTCFFYPFYYLCGADSFFAPLQEVGYDCDSVGTLNIYPDPPYDEERLALAAPDACDYGCCGKAVLTHNSALTMVASFSWARLRDYGQNTRIDLINAVMNWLSLNTGTEDVVAPDQFSLSQNYPNPFNANTTISFVAPNDGHISLVVYNLKGQRVRTLVDGFVGAGRESVIWDGTNDEGQPVASGIYYYMLTSENAAQVKKMTLLK